MKFRTIVFVDTLMLTLGCVAASSLQGHSATPAPIATTAQTVATVNGPWRFHSGDDARWADPAFDDSSWETYTIDPVHAWLTVPEVLEAAPLAGWQAHGHPGYVGYAWYRISIDPTSDRSALAILMPQYVDDSYQVYANGKQIGGFGQFGDHHFAYYSRPELFPVPAGVIPATGPLTIALRFRSSKFDALPSGSNINGGLRGLPLLGPDPLLAVCYQAQIGQITNQIWAGGAFAALWGSVGLISLFLFLFTRTRREYLWAGIVLTGVAIVMACDVAGRLTPIPIQIMFAYRYVGIWIGLSAGPIFVMYLLGVHKLLWRSLNYILIGVLSTGIAIELSIYLGLAPLTTGWEGAKALLRFAALGNALLVLAIAIDGVRTLGSKAWLPLTPGLFGACGLVLELAGGRFSAVVSGLMLLVPVALLIVFLLRAAQQQRENEQYLLDMRQAQEVQQLLLPEKLPQIAGFAIDSVYLPAREVGGDFFQVLKAQTGSILIVFGDVAGKGLPAAMLVAMLVGAIRTRAKETDDPRKILDALNDRLCGNTGGGFATCIAVHISSDGAVRLANAGHLEPYLNGKEIGLDGALPLGVAAGIEFVVASFALQPGDRLTFVSDGVVEATNGQKELFGFDRLREISAEDTQQIADAAKQFGQEDDITVLTLQRLPAPA